MEGGSAGQSFAPDYSYSKERKTGGNSAISAKLQATFRKKGLLLRLAGMVLFVGVVLSVLLRGSVLFYLSITLSICCVGALFTGTIVCVLFTYSCRVLVSLGVRKR